MKKSLIIAALLAVSTAATADILVGNNNAGGRIVLQEKLCVGPDGTVYKDLRSMFTTSKAGELLRGCWKPDVETGTAIVIYWTGDVRYYDANIFTVVKTKDSSKTY